MRDPGSAFDKETQLASGTGISGRLEGVAAREHERDDHGGEVFAENERGCDREERDRVDADISTYKAVRDRPDEWPKNDDGRACPDEVCRRVGAEDVEPRAGDEPDQDDEYDRELSREVREDR